MKKQKIKNLIELFVALLCVIVFAFLILDLLLAFGWELTILASVFVGAVVVILVNSIFHELGHLIFGLLSGLKFVSIKFLWLFIGKKQGKLKIELQSSGGEVGSTILAPNGTENTFKKYVVSAFGGLLFTFIILILQIALCLFLKDNLIVYAGLGITFPITAYIFLINLFPVFENNDGYLIYAYLQGGNLKKVASNYYSLASLLVEGVEPSELDSSLLIDYGGVDQFSLNIRYLRYLAFINGDEERAIKELREVSDLSKLIYVVNEVYEELFFSALLMEDKKFINAHKDEVIDIVSKQERPQSFRVHASFRVYNGDKEWAKLILKSGIEFCDTYYVKGVASSEKKYMQSMLERL